MCVRHGQLRWAAEGDVAAQAVEVAIEGVAQLGVLAGVVWSWLASAGSSIRWTLVVCSRTGNLLAHGLGVPMAGPSLAQRIRPARPAACRATSWRRWVVQTTRRTSSGSVQTCPGAEQGR